MKKRVARTLRRGSGWCWDQMEVYRPRFRVWAERLEDWADRLDPRPPPPPPQHFDHVHGAGFDGWGG